MWRKNTYVYNLGYIGHIYGHYKYGIHAIYGTLGGNWHTYNIWYLERNCHHKNIPQANLCREIAIIYNWMTVFSLHLDDAILFILVLLSLLKYTHALHFWRQQLLCQLICKWAVLQPANIQKYLFQISRNTHFKYSEILISHIQKYLFQIFRNTFEKKIDIWLYQIIRNTFLRNVFIYFMV